MESKKIYTYTIYKTADKQKDLFCIAILEDSCGKRGLNVVEMGEKEGKVKIGDQVSLIGEDSFGNEIYTLA